MTNKLQKLGGKTLAFINFVFNGLKSLFIIFIPVYFLMTRYTLIDDNSVKLTLAGTTVVLTLAFFFGKKIIGFISNLPNGFFRAIVLRIVYAIPLLAGYFLLDNVIVNAELVSGLLEMYMGSFAVGSVFGVFGLITAFERDRRRTLRDLNIK